MTFEEFARREERLNGRYNLLVDVLAHYERKNNLNAYAGTEHRMQLIERQIENLHEEVRVYGIYA